MSSLASPAFGACHDKTIDLINGFIRDVQSLLKATIPSPINSVVMLFHYIRLRFDICTMNKDVIKNDGKLFCVNSGYYLNAGISRGAKMGQFQFKINKFEARSLSVGITSDIENCRSENWITHYQYGHTYFVLVRRQGSSPGYKSSSFNRNFTAPEWKSGDVMKIEWDSNQETFKYYVNDKEEGVMNTEKGLIYYACVCSPGNAHVELELID